MTQIIIKAEDGKEFGRVHIHAQHDWGYKLNEYMPNIIRALQTCMDYEAGDYVEIFNLRGHD